MRLLAIDPGPEKSGYVIWDGKRVIDSGHKENKKIKEYLMDGSTHVAIEMIASYGMAVGASVFNTCVEIGKFVEYANIYVPNAPVEFVYRNNIKVFVCGTSKAKDANIRQSLIDSIGVVGTKANPGPLYGVKSHAWAALAVAVTATNDERLPGHRPLQPAA
jgi:hypothetical protein